MPNRRQAIIWTNVDLIHWHIYAALAGDKFTLLNIQQGKGVNHNLMLWCHSIANALELGFFTLSHRYGIQILAITGSGNGLLLHQYICKFCINIGNTNTVDIIHLLDSQYNTMTSHSIFLIQCRHKILVNGNEIFVNQMDGLSWKRYNHVAYVQLKSWLFLDPINVTYIDGLVQEKRNSNVLAMVLHLSCTNPSRYHPYDATSQHSVTNDFRLYFLVCKITWFAKQIILLNCWNVECQMPTDT